MVGCECTKLQGEGIEVRLGTRRANSPRKAMCHKSQDQVVAKTRFGAARGVSASVCVQQRFGAMMSCAHSICDGRTDQGAQSKSNEAARNECPPRRASSSGCLRIQELAGAVMQCVPCGMRVSEAHPPGGRQGQRRERKMYWSALAAACKTRWSPWAVWYTVVQNAGCWRAAFRRGQRGDHCTRVTRRRTGPGRGCSVRRRGWRCRWRWWSAGWLG